MRPLLRASDRRQPLASAWIGSAPRRPFPRQCTANASTRRWSSHIILQAGKVAGPALRHAPASVSSARTLTSHGAGTPLPQGSTCSGTPSPSSQQARRRCLSSVSIALMPVSRLFRTGAVGTLARGRSDRPRPASARSFRKLLNAACAWLNSPGSSAGRSRQDPAVGVELSLPSFHSSCRLSDGGLYPRARSSLILGRPWPSKS